MDGPEDYCIVSHLQDNPEECFVCDATIPKLSHETKNMISNFNGRTEKTWWQSENIKEDVYLQVNKYYTEDVFLQATQAYRVCVLTQREINCIL